MPGLQISPLPPIQKYSSALCLLFNWLINPEADKYFIGIEVCSDISNSWIIYTSVVLLRPRRQKMRNSCTEKFWRTLELRLGFLCGRKFLTWQKRVSYSPRRPQDLIGSLDGAILLFFTTPFFIVAIGAHRCRSRRHADKMLHQV